MLVMIYMQISIQSSRAIWYRSFPKVINAVAVLRLNAHITERSPSQILYACLNGSYAPWVYPVCCCG